PDPGQRQPRLARGRWDQRVTRLFPTPDVTVEVTGEASAAGTHGARRTGVVRRVHRERAWKRRTAKGPQQPGRAPARRTIRVRASLQMGQPSPALWEPWSPGAR
ncbi:hypothetical protein H1C71_032925, partial [Ictidomys tridecemlineatus]